MDNGTERIAPGVWSKLNLAIDLALLAASLRADSILYGTPAPHAARAGLWWLAAAVALWMLSATALRHYAGRRTATEELAATALLVASQAAVLAVLHALGVAGLPGAGAFMAFVMPAALAAKAATVPLRAREAPVRDVLLVGVGPLGRATEAELAGVRARLAGALSLPGERPSEALEPWMLGSHSDLARVLSERAFAEVFVAVDEPRHRDDVQQVVRTCETFGIPFALPVHGYRLDRSRPSDRRLAAEGYVHYVPFEPKPAQRAVKRLVDVLGAGAAIVLLSPLLAAVAMLVKTTSPGPVLFRQKRSGLHGRVFHMLKFRSMVADAEARRAKLETLNEQDGPVFKIRNDPRVTPLGRFLRKFSLDELPQFFNVLAGDMSLVGPRPPVPAEVAKYEPWQRRRLSVRPGLTCIWQISGRNRISFEDWMYLDMRYIDHWSLLGDFDLLLRTVPVVVTGRGAS